MYNIFLSCSFFQAKRRRVTIFRQNHILSSSSDSDSGSVVSDFSDNDDMLMNRRRYQRRHHNRESIPFVNRTQEVPSDPPSPYENSPPHSPNSFMNHSTLVQNNSFSATLTQVDHRRNVRFRLSDHLYDLTVNARNHREVLISDLFPLLQQAITAALVRLQEIYNNDYRRQVYVTVIDRSCDSGLNSGNYDLRTNPEIIANHVLNMLEAFIQSHLTLKLNDSFHIKFKVLSVEHYNDLIANNPNFVPHMAVRGNDSKRKYPSYIKSFPAFCDLHKQNCFINKCLLLSVIGGIELLNFHEGHFESYQKLKKNIF